MITQTTDETRAAGRALAHRLRPGDIVLLEGPLGSGKTTFVQGVAEGLGASQPVTSPSFVIVNEYQIGDRKSEVGNQNDLISDSRHPISILRHIDLYRLPDPTVDLERIGLRELLADPQAVTVVEWAERLPLTAQVPGRRFRVTLTHGAHAAERRVTIPPLT